MKGDWTGAVNVLEDLAEHLEDKSAHIEMKFILLEKKYLQGRTHELAGYLMLGQAPPSATPTGHAPSRAGVMERLQVSRSE